MGSNPVQSNRFGRNSSNIPHDARRSTTTVSAYAKIMQSRQKDALKFEFNCMMMYPYFTGCLVAKVAHGNI